MRILLVIIVIIVILTIILWFKGWKWKALLPLGIGLIAAYIFCFVCGKTGVLWNVVLHRLIYLEIGVFAILFLMGFRKKF